jgi:hypothetical protein
MEDTKQKIIKRLDELINQIPELRKEYHESEKIGLWQERVKKILERIGGESLVRKFNSAGAFAFHMNPSDAEKQEYYLKQINGWSNFLIALKEDLELFDESDNEGLKKIKHKFEMGANLGIVKGKYSQEREK